MIRTLRADGVLFLAAAAAYSMSTLFSAMKPVVLTGFVKEQGIADGWAGLLAAMPFVGIACAALLGARVPVHLSFRKLAVVLSLLLVACEGLTSLVVESLAAVLSLQFGAGLAVGLLMGASSSHIARSRTPDKLFGVVDMVAVLMMSIMVMAVGSAMSQGGLSGVFLLAAAISGGLGLLTLGFRGGDTADTARSAGPVAPLAVTARALAVVLMGVLFVTSSGLGFAYMFTIAGELGMDYAIAGERIGLLLFVSAFACAAGGWCSARFGPYRPLAMAYVLCAAGWLVATQTSSPTLFLAALVPGIFALQFCFPVLLSLSGALDRQGRWAAIATPVQTSGFAWAAILAGLLVSSLGTRAIGYACATGMALCLLLLWLSRPHASELAPAS